LKIVSSNLKLRRISNKQSNNNILTPLVYEDLRLINSLSLER